MTEVEMRTIRTAVFQMSRAPEFARVRQVVQAKAFSGENSAPTIQAILSELGRILGEAAVLDTKIETSFVR